MENYYEVLGCMNDASYEELKRAYQDLVLKHHPDKAAQQQAASGKQGDGCQDTQAFIKVKKAWDILSTEDTRKEYDARWKQRSIAQEWPVQDEVEFEDFDYNIEEERYLHTCRCGGEYVLSPLDVTFKVDFVNCVYCSLHVQVIYSEEAADVMENGGTDEAHS